MYNYNANESTVRVVCNKVYIPGGLFRKTHIINPRPSAVSSVGGGLEDVEGHKDVENEDLQEHPRGAFVT